MAALDNRITTLERDFSGFVNINPSQTGAMVVKSGKGPRLPVACNGESDVIKYFGSPSAKYPALFEAVEYAKQNQLWVSAAYTTDALYAGVDVYTSTVTNFGTRTGRDLDTFIDYSTIEKEGTPYSAGTGNGIIAAYSGTVTGISLTNKIKNASFILKVGGTTKLVTETGGTLTGTDLSAPGTLNKDTGAYVISFAGVAGSEAAITTTVDGSSDFNLSVGLPKAFNITIDGILFENVNLGSSASKTLAQVVSDINTAVGYSAASVSGNFILIEGQIPDATFGNITVTAPTDTVTYASALALVFTPGVTFTINGTNPTGAIPRYNQSVSIEYVTTSDQSLNISHSFFQISPSETLDLAVNIIHVSGSIYTLSLYLKTASGNNALESAYTYSLLREKDAFGRSLYIFDVFDGNSYVVPVVNNDYVATATPAATTIVDVTGGYRGTEPLTSNYLASWNNFQLANRYPVKTFLDPIGNAAAIIVDIRNLYQKQAFCITTVPFGNSPAQAITFRQGLSLDTDQIALYHGWTYVVDPYNNSFAWVSRIGAVGVKYAQMDDVFDSLSPAGIDENGHGGQITSTFTPKKMENDYSFDIQLNNADNAQINPIILDPTYGLLIVGDRTLKVINSDSSFVGTRRLYNLLVDTISSQILKQQVFKNNDVTHRARAKSLTEQLLEPILIGEFLREAAVVCDLTNNTDNILNQRKFLLSVYVKATPNSQRVILELTRLPQNVILADFVPA